MTNTKLSIKKKVAKAQQRCSGTLCRSFPTFYVPNPELAYCVPLLKVALYSVVFLHQVVSLTHTHTQQEMVGIKITSSRELQEALAHDHSTLVAVGFFIPSQPQSKQIATVMELLMEDHKNALRYCIVELPDLNSLSEEYTQYKITKAPTVLLFKRAVEVGRVEGAQAPVLVTTVKRLCSSETSCNHPPQSKPVNVDTTSQKLPLQDRLRALVQSHPVMLFMKGSKEEPFCRFSKQAVAILRKLNIPFGSFDVFQDEAVRQGMKEFSDWPTFPQLYVNSEFIGGVDIMSEMYADGSLEKLLLPSAKN